MPVGRDLHIDVYLPVFNTNERKLRHFFPATDINLLSPGRSLEARAPTDETALARFSADRQYQ